MYRLNAYESAALGEFLRTICRLGFLDSAKRIASMPDAQLSILIQSEKLWNAVDSEEKYNETREGQ